MGVGDVVNTVVVIICVEVILDAVTVKVTWPFELVNTSVVVIVFIVTSRSRAIRVFVGDAIVIVVHWILVCKVERSDWLSSPWVDDVWVEAAVGTDISWV